MRILLTGGSGDLGIQLSPILRSQGHTVLNLDPREPGSTHATHYQGSILDLATLRRVTRDVDVVIHIAAWHGIHEGQKSQTDFQSLNVEGTRNIVHCWSEQIFRDLIFISSSSVMKADSFYGQTKRDAEAMVTQAAQGHDLKAITLRPRGFIPPWNSVVYDSFTEWGRYFYSGAVHIDDVVQAVLLSLRKLPENDPGKNPTFMIDRKPDFSEDELQNWDANGTGSSFARKFPQFIAQAKFAKLPIHQPPRYYDISQSQKLLGYHPGYQLEDMLLELDKMSD